MAKPNTYVQLLQAQQTIAQLRRDMDIIKGFTVQQSLDGHNCPSQRVPLRAQNGAPF